MLGDTVINLYYGIVLEEIEPLLTGTHLVPQSEEPIPPGTQMVTREKLLKLQGKAKRGAKGQPIPREMGTIQRGTTYIPEHAHGFKVHKKDMLAAQRGDTPLPDASARQSTRLVAELIEDMIFNGIPELDIKGIYKDAAANGGEPYTVTTNQEWNTSNADPFNNIVAMAELLGETNRYSPKAMVIGSQAYYSLFQTNELGISYASMINESGLFPNGMESIYRAPLPANHDAPPIIPVDAGVMLDIDPQIAERYVEEEIHVEEPYGGALDKDQNYLFNVLGYQGQDIHFPEAMLQLQNLVKTA